MDDSVRSVFDSYPDKYRRPLLQIRELIYSIASKIPEVGGLEESLKWGQPSYSTVKKIGSPIRLDRFGADKIAIFFNCQTSLVSNFIRLFGDKLDFSNNRAIVINPNEKLTIDELSFCIDKALTYHLNKSNKVFL